MTAGVRCYILVMRYAPRGGQTAAGRTKREAVRFEAAEMFEQGLRPPEVARRLRVTRKSAYAWRATWRDGGKPALSSKGPGGFPCQLSDNQANPRCGLVVFGLQQPQGFDGVHARQSHIVMPGGRGGGEAAEHAGGGGPVDAGGGVLGPVVVVAGETAVEHKGAVDLFDHPAFRLRNEASAAVVRITTDHLDGDVVDRPVDDHGVP